MPVLKATPVVEFNPYNADHVQAVLEVDILGKRSLKFNFDYPPEFQSGMNYARFRMSQAWGELMAERFPQIQKVLDSAPEVTLAHVPGTKVEKTVVIGKRAQALQEVFNRESSDKSTIK